MHVEGVSLYCGFSARKSVHATESVPFHVFTDSAVHGVLKDFVRSREGYAQTPKSSSVISR